MVRPGAETFGLTGAVAEKDFLALCEGLHPQTGQKLTQRLNTVRFENGEVTANRQIFHDFTISPPKSVSIVALYEDSRVIEEHRRAIRCALGELEKLAETRVRKSKQNGERVTGNIVAACFRHDTIRELDPYLHTHCVVFNATHDPVEKRWKALQTGGMYCAQKFVENLYFHELAKGLRSLGYEIENNARNFEIKHVPKSVITRFSKRHEQIDAEAQWQAANGYGGDLGELRTRVAHELRRRKIKNSTADELRSHWGKQLSHDEQRVLATLRVASPGQAQIADVRGIVAWADGHLFERRSVVNDYELMAAALARGRGESFDLADLGRAIAERDYYQAKNTHKLTSRELIRCEFEIVSAVRDNRNCFFDLAHNYEPAPGLSAEQAQAARRILTTPDKIELRENIQRSGNRDLALDQDASNATAESLRVQERAERIREHIELACRHQFFTQRIEHTQHVRQRI